MNRTSRRLLAAAACAWAASASALDISIHTQTEDGFLRLGGYDHSAWAVCSLELRGTQYLDAFDHGRCLQSAASFDGLGENFNPTQAGGVMDGRIDGAAPGTSSSSVVALSASGSTIASSVRMAFWKPVDQQRTSGYLHTQRITIGLGPLRNVMSHEITFTIPEGDTHTLGQFENLTGYMPAQFSRFRTFDPVSGALGPLSDGPGEQALPVIFCTENDRHCMGVISPAPLPRGGYGRWRFGPFQCITHDGATGCVKWNVVTRVANPSGTYTAPPIFTAVGPLEDVVAGLKWARTAGTAH